VQATAANDQGETTLHAIALDKPPAYVYYQLRRGVDPLQTTRSGQSVLLYAACNDHCPQKMVAECIRHGFSTYQPQLTLDHGIVHGLVEDIVSGTRSSLLNTISSPLLMVILRDLPDVAYMLYESGAPSYKELFWLHDHLSSIVFSYERMHCSTQLTAIKNFMPYLKHMATNPRRLESMSRLAFAHRFTIRGKRVAEIEHLEDIPELIKQYITFSDLTDKTFKFSKDIVSYPFELMRLRD
jgi:hypothetical protein